MLIALLFADGIRLSSSTADQKTQEESTMQRSAGVCMRVVLLFAALASTSLFPSKQALAQVDTGALLGTVRDQSGAVVPGARVTLIDEGTSFAVTIISGRDGTYIFRPIKIGTYSVEAEYQGFRKVKRTGIDVSIQTQVVVDLMLVPGAVNETVTVTSALPLLQTQSGSVGEVMDSGSINNLPLNGRNFNFLARLTAGVTRAQPDTRGLDANGWFAANGTRPAQNNLLLDGIDNNSNNVDFLNGAAYVLKPPVDAVAEFKIQTSSFDAQFGRAGGAVLNVSLKSGTNKFHGSAWEFVRNDIFDAADYFQNAAHQPKGEYRQNQFGGSIGGPIRKNKTFWFADYEGLRVRQATPWVASVPTAVERASGYTDFRDLVTGQTGVAGTDVLGRSFQLGTIFDPATTRPVTQGQVDPVTGLTAHATGYVRDQIQCNGIANTICPGRLDPNAIKLLDLFPDPIGPGLVNNYLNSPVAADRADQFDVRIDQNFSERDRLFGRYSFYDETSFKPAPFSGFADGGGFAQGTQTNRNQGAGISWTHTFSSTLINETRVGFNREHVYRVQPFGDDTSNIPGQFGIQGIPQAKGNGGLPTILIGGLGQTPQPNVRGQLGSGEWLVSERFSSTYQLTDNLTKLYKSHTFKGGAEIQLIDFPWIAPPFSRGEFSFSGAYTSIPNIADGSTSRAQFLLPPTTATVMGGVNNLGGTDSVQASNFGELSPYKRYYGAYFQDDWKVKQKLTLNLGIRWDFFTAVGDKQGAQGNIVPGPPGSAKFLIPTKRKGDPLSSSFTNLLQTDGIQLVYTDSYGAGLITTQKTNFAPRLGFAYQLTPKWVLRGGYGIFYGGFENRGGYPALGYNYPFQYSFSFPSSNSWTPVTYSDGQIATLERGFLSIPLRPDLVQANGLAFRGIQLDYQTPYMQSYNLTTQYELAPGNSLEVGYVASLGRHIETFTGTNNVAQLLPPGTDPQLYVPFPDFARGSPYATTNANSNYHSLQTRYTRRMAKGLEVLAAFTWAKALTNAGDLLSGGNVGGFRAPGIPGFGIARDYGLADFDIRKSFSLSGNYQLPVGRGRHFLSTGGRVTDALFGGWSMNWILTLADGQPVTINCVTPGAAGVGCYAELVPGQDRYAGKHNVDQWMNPAAFTDPPPAMTIGQTDFSPLGGDKTPIIAPGFHRMDWSLFKEFNTSETTRLEFRAEFFNLTNHPNFAAPSQRNYKDTAHFGQITSTIDSPNDPRQIQFALKFYF
jgi:Carboxypeptidase regulatory-like domain